ncbi:hypothetical protein PG987_014042 [Apiospora arundinis]
MASVRVNNDLVLRESSTSAKGAGLFATRDLERGRRVLCEDPLLECSEPSQAASGRRGNGSRLSDHEMQRLARLPAGPGQPFQVLSGAARLPLHNLFGGDGGARLTNTIKYNQVRIATAKHPMVGFYTAAASHRYERLMILTSLKTGLGLNADRHRFLTSCSPNAYLSHNETTSTLDLYLVHRVKKGEEITVSYFQDDYACPQSVRAQRLQKWRFVCACACCTTDLAVSDARRNEIKRLYSEHDQLDIARLLHCTSLAREWHWEAHREDEYVWDLATCVRTIIQHMKDEGMYGLALTWVLVDYAEHCEKMGNRRMWRENMREALQIREMCLGPFHASTRDLANRIA